MYMIVQCPNCKFIFEIDENDVNYCYGPGAPIPFVSCRNPHPLGFTNSKTFYCDEFIDLSHAFGNNAPASTSASDDSKQTSSKEPCN